MKTLRLESEWQKPGKKPKRLKIDQETLVKIGNALYHTDDIKSVSIKVKYKNGASTIFNRSEDEDRFDRLKERIDEDEED
jgi:hypothetical protein